MSRKAIVRFAVAVLSLLPCGCGACKWNHVVVETRVLILTPVPVHVSHKIDLTSNGSPK